MNKSPESKIKVAIFQPALPKYRIPLFSSLGQSFHVKVFFDTERNLSNDQADGFENRSIKDWKIKMQSGKDIVWSWAQISACGDRSWDVIVLPWNIRYLSLFTSLARAKFNGIPTILWGHGYSKKSGFIRTWVRNRITGLASAVLFYDPVTKDEFEKLTQLKNCFAAPNAIDPTPIRKQVEMWSEGSRLDQFKEQHDLIGRDIVLFVSRFDPDNRLELLVRALPEIKQKRPSILAVLVGGGRDEEKLRSLVKELGCEENVLFTGPVYEEEELAPWFLSSSLFCYPTNIGLSLMHAFNYGLPVVVGDDFTRCNPEIYAFKDGFNGVTFEDREPKDLAKCLLNLFASPDVLQSLADGAMETAQTRTTLDKFVQGYSQAIEFASSSINRQE